MKLETTLRKARRLGARAVLQKVLEEVQFRYDLLSGPNYQPLPWIDLNNAKRGHGTEERWQIIEKALDGQDAASAMDIGCNLGYFCFALAQNGIPTLGIEANDRYLRIARYAARRIRAGNVAFCNMEVSPANIALLPDVDVVLLLSVWHHWIRRYGLERATELLSAVWERCDKALFFETGGAEIPEVGDLHAVGSLPAEWLDRYLQNTCGGSTVVNLGRTTAFVTNSSGVRKVVPRDLYMVARDAVQSVAQATYRVLAIGITSCLAAI